MSRFERKKQIQFVQLNKIKISEKQRAILFKPILV